MMVGVAGKRASRCRVFADGPVGQLMMLQDTLQELVHATSGEAQREMVFLAGLLNMIQHHSHNPDGPAQGVPFPSHNEPMLRGSESRSPVVTQRSTGIPRGGARKHARKRACRGKEYRAGEMCVWTVGDTWEGPSDVTHR